MKHKRILTLNKDNAKSPVSLIRDSKGLSLSWNGMLLRGDFTEMLPRLRRGMLESELIVKASGILKANATADVSHFTDSCTAPQIEPADEIISTCMSAPLAIDATAGLGEDSLLLAAAGFRVILYEKDRTIFSLLKDAYERAFALPSDPEYTILKSALSRMEIYNDDSVTSMLQLAQGLDKEHDMSVDGSFNSQSAQSRPDVIFLDPMFPERKKSSLVGKKLQILQQLEAPCDNEVELLNAAKALNPKRIIIKRPPKGPYLGGIKPTFSLSGKSIRIDCIVI